MQGLNWNDLIKIATGIDKDAAASEAKKNALQKKYPNLTPNDVELAAETDPTPNGEYTEWLCREISKSNLDSWEAESTPDAVVVATLKTFIRLKQSPDFIKACKEGLFDSDIMKKSFNELYNTCKYAEHLISRNQQERDLIQKHLSWTGEYEGNNTTAKVDVYYFGDGEGEAYALTSSGPSLDPEFNPLPNTAWCTTQFDTAEEYLSTGDASIIRVNGKNFCNIHDDSHQCMDAKNRSFAPGLKAISNPIVQFAIKGAKINLQNFVLGEETCYLCHKPYINPQQDTREGREGKLMCLQCFHKDWTSEIKRFVMTLYNANPDAFNEEPTTGNMKKWLLDMWNVDGDERERNFWFPSDVKEVLQALDVVKD